MRFLTISLVSFEIYKVTQTSHKIKVLVTKLVQIKKIALTKYFKKRDKTFIS